MKAHAPSVIVRHVREWLAVREGGGPADAELLRRFAAQHDDAAFETLVRRHGGLVLGVCRRVLGDAHDAEDAFQATFLVLARKATTIHRAASLACWLHGVAYRVALEARKCAARRRARERQAAIYEASPGSDDTVASEIRAILDEELGRLPEKYRTPLTLHYLEGCTKEETARALGWTEGTVSGRLARARDLLRIRLTRRGIAVTSAALSAALSQELAPAGALSTLMASTLHIVGLSAAGEAALAGESARIIALTEKVLRTMVLTKLKIATATLLMAAVAVLGVAGVLFRAEADPAADQPAQAQVRPADNKAFAGAAGKSDRPLLRVPLPARTMMTVTLSADGKLLAVAPHDKTTVQLWDVATGKERTLKGHAFSVTALAFASDGKTLASATGSWLPDGAPGEIKLWDVASGKELASLARLPTMVLALAFSPDGKTLASVSQTVKLWDVAAGKETADFPVKNANSVAFAPDGKTLAVGWGVREDNTPGAVALWDTTTGKERATLAGHVGMVWCVGFTPDGKTLASGDSRGTLKLWDTATAKERASIRPPEDTSGSYFLQSIAFPADSKTVVGTMMLYWPREERSACVLKEWDAADGKERATYPAKAKADVKDSPLAVSGDGTIVGLASPAGEALLVAPGVGKLELWERRSLGTREADSAKPESENLRGASQLKPAQTQEDPVRNELKKLEGSWIAVAYESGREKAEGDEFKKTDLGHTLIIKDGTFQTIDKDVKGPRYTLTIDPAKTPKALDRTGTVEGKKDVARSIYELDGGTLRLCTAFEFAHVRPRAFTQEGTYVMVYKRLQPDAADAAKKELNQLKGVWICVGYEIDGEQHVGDQVREALWNERLWFRGSTPTDDWLHLNWERKGKQTASAAVFKLYPGTNPKGIDLTWRARAAQDFMPKGIDPGWEGGQSEKNGGKTHRGIYAVDGGILRLCWSEPGKDRPTTLTTKRGDNRTVHLYERKKEK